MNPFTDTKTGSVREWGERRLIEAVRTWLGDASPPPPQGIGDDCAVFSPSPGAHALVTTDPVLWGRHFDETVAPEQVAVKLLKRNLSDIAAMGGRPRIAVVSLLLAPSTSLAWLKRFHLGLRDACLRYSVPLAGGDVSETAEGLLGACMTLVGETTRERYLTRDGAAAGDHLFVTGTLGGSRSGHHLSFEPRLAEGEWLAGRAEVVAAIDLSDGLAKDLPAIVPGGCEAELFADRIPLSDEGMRAASESGRSALFHALCDGEDYEILFAARGDPAETEKEWGQHFSLPLARIGILRERHPESQESLLRGLPAGLAETIEGYEHFGKT